MRLKMQGLRNKFFDKKASPFEFSFPFLLTSWFFKACAQFSNAVLQSVTVSYNYLIIIFKCFLRGSNTESGPDDERVYGRTDGRTEDYVHTHGVEMASSKGWEVVLHTEIWCQYFYRSEFNKRAGQSLDYSWIFSSPLILLGSMPSKQYVWKITNKIMFHFDF